MIAYIKGTVAEILQNEVVLENQNIGYTISVPGTVVEQLPSVGETVKLFTYMQVREDSVHLYGFIRKEELEVFKKLLTVNSVGPKAALGILSVLSYKELIMAVHSQNAKQIAKAPGVGAKTAQRIIIDLKDRFELEDAWQEERIDSPVMDSEKGVQKEAIEALTALGYGVGEATKAVKQVAVTPEMTVEECLKQSLKYML